jgi:ApbE superfamily uncharacterized protein (UPF0280 family)
MAHNVYINIIISTDKEEFPNEYGIISNLRKEVKKIIANDPSFKMRRYNFDIIDELLDTEGEFEIKDE